MPMIAFMEQVKENRLEKLRLDTIKSRRELFRKYIESSDLFAAIPVVEASQLDLIRDLIEDSPVDYELTKASFEPFKCSLVAFFNMWAASKKPVLLQLVQNSAVPSEPNLALATTFFRFGGNDEPIHAQHVLIHPKLFSRYGLGFQLSTAQQQLFKDFNHATWNFQDRLSFHKPAFLAAQLILSSCVPKANASLATADEMDWWNPLLECTTCYDNTLGRLIMTWRQAVRLTFDPNNGC
jgi:hypothetical protein